MKKAFLILLLSSPCLAGTITTYGTNMQIAYVATPARSEPAPTSPIVAGAFVSSVSVTWGSVNSDLGYDVEASSTNFNGTGVYYSSVTTSGSATGLIVGNAGLSASTQYYLKVGSRWSDGTTTYVNTVPTSTTTLASAGNSDSFTGADATALATHDANWVSMDATNVTTNCTIQSNTLQETGGGGYSNCGAMYNTSSADTSQMLVKASADIFTYKNVCVRSGVAAGATKTGYCAKLAHITGANWDQIEIDKDGTYLDIKSISAATASDHTLKITASGTSTVTITTYVDGASAGTSSDSTSPYGTGKPGFMTYGNGSAGTSGIDDWQDH